MASHTNPSMTAAFRISLILIAGLALLVIATCGKDSPTKPTPPQPPTPPPTQQVPTRIMITPATTTLTAIGQTAQLSATVLDQNGQPVPGAVVTWSSGNAAVATVNSQGLVTAVMNGAAQITARAGNASASVNVTVTDTSRDRDALIALYHATNGPDWSSKSNWLSDLPLGDWFGVMTNAQGEVTRLELRLNNVQGSIPAEIGKLKNLIYLSFLGNHLSGHIPPEIGQIKNLRVLRLWNNRLTGGIPPEIGQLRNLTVLTLGRNQLAGTLPSELGQLENLLELRLDENTELSGPLPTEFTRMTQLRRLRLNGTETCIPPTTPFHQWLSGIPAKSISAYCTSPERDALIALYRRTNGRNWTNSTNWTSYTSPGDWFGVTTDADGKVTKLVLQDNNMSGLLPGQLSDLTRLEVLNLSSNSGLSASIPRSFTGLDLSALDLGGTQVCAPVDDQFREW
ncbi:MAG: leucine-rich repeat domain-containing protein, partial [Gemmatimonadetes bacterium]|nr:leucine-rich repeat domain-containing protein [Gemmatimonadota bacterium]